MRSTAELLALSRRYCGMPEHLHPVSERFLLAFLEGRMSRRNFQRFFSLPNSDYIPLAACVVELFDGVWDFSADLAQGPVR